MQARLIYMLIERQIEKENNDNFSGRLQWFWVSVLNHKSTTRLASFNTSRATCFLKYGLRMTSSAL